MGRVKLVKTPSRWRHRWPATDFEQVCGAAQAALRISRFVSDVVRAYGVAGGRRLWLDLTETSYPSISTAKATRCPKPESPISNLQMSLYICRFIYRFRLGRLAGSRRTRAPQPRPERTLSPVGRLDVFSGCRLRVENKARLTGQTVPERRAEIDCGLHNPQPLTVGLIKGAAKRS